MEKIRMLVIVYFFSLWGGTVMAGDLEDFAGGVSNTRVTINPATVGTIDRIHVQYNIFGYDTEALLPSFLDRLSINGVKGEIFAPDDDTLVEAINYTEGRVDLFHFAFVWPFEFLSLGIQQDQTAEKYSDGVFVSSRGEDLLTPENETGVRSKFDQGTTSYLIGVPFGGFTLGLRLSERTLKHRVDFLNPAAIAEPGLPFTRTEIPGAGFDLDGDAKYSFWDFGLMLPEFIPGVDLGIMHRNPVQAKMKFAPGEFKALPPNVTVSNFEFEEPSLTIVGVGYIFDLGFSALQLLGDYGIYGNTGVNGANREGDNGNRSGGLTRFVLPPLIDITYGIQEETLAGLTATSITTSAQIPIPFTEGYNLKFGTRSYKVEDSGGEIVVDTTFVLFSFNFQFGERVGRALQLKPKTKEIRFIDRL